MKVEVEFTTDVRAEVLDLLVERLRGCSPVRHPLLRGREGPIDRPRGESAGSGTSLPTERGGVVVEVREWRAVGVHHHGQVAAVSDAATADPSFRLSVKSANCCLSSAMMSSMGIVWPGLRTRRSYSSTSSAVSFGPYSSNRARTLSAGRSTPSPCRRASGPKSVRSPPSARWRLPAAPPAGTACRRRGAGRRTRRRRGGHGVSSRFPIAFYVAAADSAILDVKTLEGPPCA